jgi:hypothetical protein
MYSKKGMILIERMQLEETSIYPIKKIKSQIMSYVNSIVNCKDEEEDR